MENNHNHKKKIEIKAYTIRELGGFYGVTPKTFRGWVVKHKAAIGKRYGRYFNAKQVRKMLDIFGLPGDYEATE